MLFHKENWYSYKQKKSIHLSIPNVLVKSSLNLIFLALYTTTSLLPILWFTDWASQAPPEWDFETLEILIEWSGRVLLRVWHLVNMWRGSKMSHVDIEEKSLCGKGNSRCKGPVVGYGWCLSLRCVTKMVTQEYCRSWWRYKNAH